MDFVTDAQPSGEPDAPIHDFYLASIGAARRLPFTLGIDLREVHVYGTPKCIYGRLDSSVVVYWANHFARPYGAACSRRLSFRWAEVSQHDQLRSVACPVRCDRDHLSRCMDTNRFGARYSKTSSGSVVIESGQKLLLALNIAAFANSSAPCLSQRSEAKPSINTLDSFWIPIFGLARGAGIAGLYMVWSSRA